MEDKINTMDGKKGICVKQKSAEVSMVGEYSASNCAVIRVSKESLTIIPMKD